LVTTQNYKLTHAGDIAKGIYRSNKYKMNLKKERKEHEHE